MKVDEKTTFLEIKLKDDSHKLGEVVVKSKKGRYKRKDNPAVELMRRVIAAKKKSDLSNHDYYQYDKYQKITLALNDITKEQMEGKFFSKRQYLLDQVEISPYNGKLTLPVSVGRDRFAARLPQGPEEREGYHQGSAEQWYRTGNPDRRNPEYSHQGCLHRCGYL